MTVLETIQRSAEFLDHKGVESPRLQIELMLASLLKLPRMNLYLNFERSLTPDELNKARAMVQRRAAREPLQHILGSTSFCGFEIEVNSSVLVPRPETELLAEHAWTLLKNTSAPNPPPRALDFGTGSGCIAIALAAHAPAARLTALDSSAAALDVARRNATRNEVSHQIEFLLSEGFSALPTDIRFDLIVSNPPYIPTAEIETLQPEVRDHDPRQALDGGADGLDCFRYLASAAMPFLFPNGRITLEFGDGQSQAVAEIFRSQGWEIESIETDYSGTPRFLTSASPR